ncbi:MarR family transcriptional regulator [Melioribacter roseus P3M-2]|uniref:MarR family transcriptional regulator n=1 Tax=Melioribacter roseus (strain DSM 23840 / JCM 17771 / VKM B-2668 / P3M-2) TaxID=1191523 RepID=I6ZRI9_MELRP|nr:MarR family transcriptional regulator [Melioribacter roseus]AFN74689.1 MarR family transcriptional regulator [Melioribacter roseus P3M-2]
MASEKTEAAMKLIEKLNRTADKIRKVQAKYVFEKKLTAPQFAVLEILSRTGPVPLKRISDEMMVTGANITCVVDNLEKEGFVRRVHSKEDRRVILGELTPEGRKKVEGILPEYMEKLASLTSGLTESEQKQLIALLDKLTV